MFGSNRLMGKRNNEEHSGILHSSADVVGIIKSKSAECTEYSTCERDAALVEGYRQGKTEAPGENRIPVAFCTTNSRWTAVGSNLGLRCERQATNRVRLICLFSMRYAMRPKKESTSET